MNYKLFFSVMKCYAALSALSVLYEILLYMALIWHILNYVSGRLETLATKHYRIAHDALLFIAPQKITVT